MKWLLGHWFQNLSGSWTDKVTLEWGWEAISLFSINRLQGGSTSTSLPSRSSLRLISRPGIEELNNFLKISQICPFPGYHFRETRTKVGIPF